MISLAHSTHLKTNLFLMRFPRVRYPSHVRSCLTLPFTKLSTRVAGLKKNTHFDFWILCFDKLDWLIVLFFSFGFLFLTSRNSRNWINPNCRFPFDQKINRREKRNKTEQLLGFYKSQPFGPPSVLFHLELECGNNDDVERRRRDHLIGGRQPPLNPARKTRERRIPCQLLYNKNVSLS